VYFPLLADARDEVLVDFAVVVVRVVVDAAGDDGGDGGAACEADAVVFGDEVEDGLSPVVDATAAVSEPWQRCIQKSI
jgi:hypothetical protein